LSNHGTGRNRTVKSRAIFIAADEYVCTLKLKHFPLVSPIHPFQLYDIGSHWNRVRRKKTPVYTVAQPITLKHNIRKVLDGNILK